MTYLIDLLGKMTVNNRIWTYPKVVTKAITIFQLFIIFLVGVRIVKHSNLLGAPYR
jgi:hypothetical protein